MLQDCVGHKQHLRLQAKLGSLAAFTHLSAGAIWLAAASRFSSRDCK